MLPFPGLAQILPPRIHGFDQCDLLLSSDALQLFLTSDSRLDVVIAFVIDEPVAPIFFGEAFECACFVLAHARLKSLVTPM